MLLASIFFLLSPKAVAWDKHQVLLERLFDTKASKKRFYPYQKISIPCEDQEKKEINRLAQVLHIQGAKVPVFSAGRCKAGETSTQIILSDLLLSSAIDEPDMGMDQDLPESEDPSHERRWMGGTTGFTSQGFRHMYFKGMFKGADILSPIKTLQIPIWAVGQALERIRIMHEASADYFSHGDKFWGTRVLLWELHSIQDLQQPFHVLQIPSTSFIPWTKLFSIVRAATSSIANYHFAYEGVTLEWLKDKSDSEFLNCLEPPDDDVVFDDPIELIDYPRSVGNDLGQQLYKFLGDDPKSASFSPDYYALIHLAVPPPLSEDESKQISKKDREMSDLRIEQWKALGNIKAITCSIMKRVAGLTWHELDRAYLQALDDSNSRKTGK